MSRRVDPTSQGKLQGAINSLRAITGYCRQRTTAQFLKEIGA